METPNTTAPVPQATPDNTPVPGGGRWRWDIALPGWVEAGDPAVAEPTAAVSEPVIASKAWQSTPASTIETTLE